MRLKRYKTTIIAIVLLFAVFVTCIPVTAQDEPEPEESAEINAYIGGNIPSVKVSEWTPITVYVVDGFGIDWERLSQVLPEWWMRILWPLNPMFPQPVQRFLGHTGLRFEWEILEGDSKGWFVRITPNEISKTNPTYVHQIQVDARIDESAVDYSVVIGIKCIRLDTFGGELGSSYIRIPVKASPANFVKMYAAITEKHAPPKSIVRFTFDVTNEGYYKDVFQFELITENGLLATFKEQSIVLNPGETRSVTLNVLTPEKLWDPGTPNKIEVQMYSHGDPIPEPVGRLVVYTEGIYISPLVGLVLIPLILILLIIYVLFFYRKAKKERELFGKPEKPWNIPVEKKHLEELKQKDKEAYEKERLMMEDEYKSAMLWYNSYLQSIRQEKRKEKSKQLNSKVTKFFKKPEKKKEKSKEKEKQPKKEKKPVEKVEKTIKEEKVKEIPEIVKEQYKTIQKKSEEMQQRKEKALLKIKHAQEKQKRKIKK